MTEFTLYCPTEEERLVVKEWLHENAPSHTASFNIGIEISITDYVEAVHFKLRFADELLRSPPDFGDTAAFYCPYIPLQTYENDNTAAKAATLLGPVLFTTRYDKDSNES